MLFLSPTSANGGEQVGTYYCGGIICHFATWVVVVVGGYFFAQS